MAFAASGTEYVLFHPTEWHYSGVNSSYPLQFEWSPGLTYGYNIPSDSEIDTNASWLYAGAQHSIGVLDSTWNGDLGDEQGNYRTCTQKPYSYWCIGLGNTKYGYKWWGEGRMVFGYNLSANNYSTIRSYDGTKFSPDAAVRTDLIYGDGAWGTTTGPVALIDCWGTDETWDGYTAPWSSPGRYSPHHFHHWNTEALGAFPLNSTIERCILTASCGDNVQYKGPGNSRYGYPTTTINRTDPDVYLSINHIQPPKALDGILTIDIAWGWHSMGINHVDRMLMITSLAETNTRYAAQGMTAAAFGTRENNRGHNTYPNNPEFNYALEGFWLYDEPGTANDMWLYHGPSGTREDPLMDSFISDWRDGRTINYFNYRFQYDEASWPYGEATKTAGYWVAPARIITDLGSFSSMIEVGLPATADDWVLYK
jgi:hypothetical protein